jgi:hypothetical protein
MANFPALAKSNAEDRIIGFLSFAPGLIGRSLVVAGKRGLAALIQPNLIELPLTNHDGVTWHAGPK